MQFSSFRLETRFRITAALERRTGSRRLILLNSGQIEFFRNPSTPSGSRFHSPDGYRNNLYRSERFIVLIAIDFRNGVGDLLARNYFAEDRVMAVQMFGWRDRYEELAAIGIGPGVGHRQNAGTGKCVFIADFVLEFVTGRAVSRADRIAALDHEIRNHA